MKRRFLDIVLDTMRALTIKTGYPVPMDRSEVYSWVRGLNLKAKGPVVLYTGALYQIMPYLESLVSILKKAKESGMLLELIGFGKRFTSSSLIRAFIKVDKKKATISNAVLRSVVLLLREVGIEPSYLYENDLYSGVLLYDLGLTETFLLQAKRVYEVFKKLGVKKIITVDPHTTYVLKNVYPKFIEGFDYEVQSYIEILSEKIERKEPKNVIEVVIHDPCFYARYQNIIEEPRKILEASGIKVLEPRRTKRFTSCCGGPIEALYPELSEAVAMDRIKELSSISKTVVTLCPICFSNLSRVKPQDVEVIDLALLVAKVRGLVTASDLWSF